ncbi:hypothetical protein NPS70_15325 [Streptomyces sp. C10-9-1]|uniref:hypothetical protein n=1 Tax=unclassified Streptomyces TaxID=2593676 RepID=UPI0021111CF9|nr:hypothetical protein [Streptomyces sp. C10-9-1]MCQ6554557.1 hypothetical protein [Streptomyces sp. C10-9-1]
MSDNTLKAAARVKVHIGSWADTAARSLRHRSDRGQGAVEYVGVIVLVALIIVAIVGTGVADDIAQGLTDKVSEILNAG